MYQIERQNVKMEMLDCLEAVIMQREQWSYVSTVDGALSVMMPGTIVKQRWSVDSLVFLPVVSAMLVW